MNIVKTVFVFLVIFVVIYASLFMFINMRQNQKDKSRFWPSIMSVAASVIITVAIASPIKAIASVERSVELELVTIINTEGKGNPIVNPGIWYGVYGKYGFSPASNEFHPDYIDDWIDPDLENYSYIISFGQPVESLSYRVWDNLDTPNRNNVRAGRVVFADSFDKWSIYIYRIPKMRIDS